MTHISGAFKKVEAKLNDNVVLITQNSGYLTCYPPEYEELDLQLVDEISIAEAHFFMTSTFTFFMSTF